jgi:hypothetical protein
MSQRIKLAERVITASRHARVAKASRFGIMISAVLTFLIFAISYYGEVVGNFTFTLDRAAQNAGITMYEDQIAKDYTARLISDKVDEAEGMTSYCGTEYTLYQLGDSVCIPTDEELSLVDGQNNGDTYIAYTFYVENAGDATVDMNFTMNIISSSMGAENALRVRIVFDGIGTTYAQRQSEKGESPGELEPLTEAFYNPIVVMNQEFTFFKPGDIVKVTIIIWWEGEDADHTVSLIGGGIKLDMQFTVTYIYD